MLGQLHSVAADAAGSLGSLFMYHFVAQSVSTSTGRRAAAFVPVVHCQSWFLPAHLMSMLEGCLKFVII